MFGARISWLRRLLLRLPERGGAFPPDAVLAFDAGGVAFLPEDLMENTWKQSSRVRPIVNGTTEDTDLGADEPFPVEEALVLGC